MDLGEIQVVSHWHFIQLLSEQMNIEIPAQKHSIVDITRFSFRSKILNFLLLKNSFDQIITHHLSKITGRSEDQQ